MSYGHGETSATLHTPHGPVTVAVRVAWVRCDGCGETRAAAMSDEAEGDASCDCLAYGWTQDGAGRDRCDECGAPWSAHREIDAATCGSFVGCPRGTHGHHCTLAPGHTGAHHTTGCDGGAT